jgi:ATPase subunit of ABC transporter with duplicated ATPase domains
MLQASALTKGYPDRLLFENASFVINRGDRMGLVGPNGCGKTTLLRLLAGAEQPDAGSVRCTVSKVRLGYLPQAICFPPGLCVRAYLDAAEEGALPDHEIARVLAGLGLDTVSLDSAVGILSGGLKTRLGLARLLVQNPNLLLLDEPTNHLDIAALEWLEGYLRCYAGTVLLVSHDRAFLDRTVTRILDIDALEHTIRAYEGDYSAYVVAKQRERVRQQQTYDVQQAWIAQMERAVDRLEGQARRIEGETIDFYRRKRAAKVARQAVVQRRRIQRLLDSEERVDRPKLARSVLVDLPQAPISGQDVLTLIDLGKCYGERRLFEGANLVLRKGERIMVMGPNGSGKTTLLRMISGAEPATWGAMRRGANVRLGYFAQEQESLDWGATPYESVRRAAPLSETQARTFLHAYLFKGDEVFTPVAKLSYGERARLALAVLVLQGCNLLLLDEPLNHLDIPSRESFERALALYDGTLLAVVHDRYFVQRFATGVWSLEAGTIRRYVDLDDRRRGQMGG